MGVYNPYEQISHSCPSCRFFNCMNYYSNKDFQHEHDCCELTKIKVIDWNAIEANDRFEKWEKWDKIIHEWIDNDIRHESCPLVEIETPHGDLKDFNKVVIYKIGADLSRENCKKYDASDLTGWVILDKDWQNVPTLIEAEE